MKHVPPDLAFAIALATKDVLDEYGPGAFALPRPVALVHEAGHAVVAHATGCRVKFVRVWREIVPGYDEEVWTGFCQTTNGTFLVDRNCKVADILRYARYTIAGLAAETICGAALPGSSLDEVVKTQMLAAIVVDKLKPNLDTAQLALAAKQVWNAEIWDETLDILRANRPALEALASELARLGEVRGRVLRKILSAVKRSERGRA